MAVQIPYFDKISFQEANPMLTGFQAGVQNAYLPQEKQQALQQAIYQNMVSGAQAPYANEMAGYARDIARTNSQAAPVAAIFNNMNPATLAYVFSHPDVMNKLFSNLNQNAANIGNPNVPAPRPNFNYSGQPTAVPAPADNTNNASASNSNGPPQSLGQMGYALANRWLTGNGNSGTSAASPKASSNPDMSNVTNTVRATLEKNGTPTEADFAHTAARYRISVPDLKKLLGYS